MNPSIRYQQQTPLQRAFGERTIPTLRVSQQTSLPPEPEPVLPASTGSTGGYVPRSFKEAVPPKPPQIGGGAVPLYAKTERPATEPSPLEEAYQQFAKRHPLEQFTSLLGSSFTDPLGYIYSTGKLAYGQITGNAEQAQREYFFKWYRPKELEAGQATQTGNLPSYLASSPYVQLPFSYGIGKVLGTAFNYAPKVVKTVGVVLGATGSAQTGSELGTSYATEGPSELAKSSAYTALTFGAGASGFKAGLQTRLALRSPTVPGRELTRTSFSQPYSATGKTTTTKIPSSDFQVSTTTYERTSSFVGRGKPIKLQRTELPKLEPFETKSITYRAEPPTRISQLIDTEFRSPAKKSITGQYTITKGYKSMRTTLEPTKPTIYKPKNALPAYREVPEAGVQETKTSTQFKNYMKKISSEFTTKEYSVKEYLAKEGIPVKTKILHPKGSLGFYEPTLKEITITSKLGTYLASSKKFKSKLSQKKLLAHEAQHAIDDKAGILSQDDFALPYEQRPSEIRAAQAEKIYTQVKKPFVEVVPKHKVSRQVISSLLGQEPSIQKGTRTRFSFVQTPVSEVVFKPELKTTTAKSTKFARMYSLSELERIRIPEQPSMLIPIVRFSYRSELQPAQATKSLQHQASLQLQKTIQRTEQKTKQKTTERTTISIRSPKTTFRSTTKTITPIIPTTPEQERKPLPVQGYIAYIKRRGKWSAVNTIPFDYLSALGLGAFRAKNTASRSFKIKPSTSTNTHTDDFYVRYWRQHSYQFYQKGDTYIQRTTYSISTPGEKREITYAPRLYKPKKMRL